MGMNLSLNALAKCLTGNWLSRKRHIRHSPKTEDLTRDVEALEDRKLLTVFTVTTPVDETNDPTTTSLREAIAQANANPGADEIEFDSSQFGQRVLLNQGELVITDPVTIKGLGSFNTVIDGQLKSRVFNILSTAGNVTLEGLTVAQGRTTDFNGRGAGIISNSIGTLTLRESTVIGNATTGAYAQGGGIFCYFGPVTLIDSTVSGNSTSGGSAPGGGLATGTGNINLINSTVSGNTTIGVNSGGGGVATYTGNIRVTNSTIAFNGTLGANSPGGGIFSGGTGLTQSNTITLNNSIIGQNRITSGQAIDISKGNGTSALVANNSLISINPGTGLSPAPLGSPDANGNLIGSFAAPIDPQLLPLASNGGTTRTHALANTSPAINAGNNTLAILKANQILAEDQSGQIRIYHTTIDMGAYELQTASALPSVSFSVATQSVSEGAGLVTLTVKLSAASSQDVTVPVTFTGTATSPDDYTVLVGSVTIPAGALSATVQVQVTEDSTVESNETLIVSLGSPTNANLGTTTTQSVTITDNDSNAPVSITLSGNNATENKANTVVGTLAVANSNSLTRSTLTIQPGGQGSLFTIVNGQLRVGSTGINYEALQGGVALVTVRATNPNGTYLDKQFSINVADVNETPSIAAGQAFATATNPTAGAVVGTVVASDPDTSVPFNRLSYRITSGNTGGAFAINALTGQITVAKPSALAGSVRKFTLQIRVSDGASSSLSAVQTVTIQVGNPFTMTLPATTGAISTNTGLTTPLSPNAGLTNVDPSVSLTTARITISTLAGGSSKDTIFVKAGGNVTIQGSSIRVNGVTVATVSGGKLGAPLSIKFTAGTASSINAVLKQITIVTTRITGSQAQRTIKFDVAAGNYNSFATMNANVINL